MFQFTVATSFIWKVEIALIFLRFLRHQYALKNHQFARRSQVEAFNLFLNQQRQHFHGKQIFIISERTSENLQQKI